MYLTPSIIDGILRAFYAFIVHPTDDDAQITTLYYYMYLYRWVILFPYYMSITKQMRYSKSFFGEFYIKGELVCVCLRAFWKSLPMYSTAFCAISTEVQKHTIDVQPH
jgi:hypothetical protein